MFVPTYQGLSAADLFRPSRSAGSDFPFTAPGALKFYRARNAIYHLFTALREDRRETARDCPDYNSGNEVLAMRAAGATIHYCPVGLDMQLDPREVERVCARHSPDVLYVIHFSAGRRPMPALVDLCRRRGMRLVEDCALALLSDADGPALGSFGDWGRVLPLQDSPGA
jgi:DNA-binding transcriptional MocR family regulator